MWLMLSCLGYIPWVNVSLALDWDSVHRLALNVVVFISVLLGTGGT